MNIPRKLIYIPALILEMAIITIHIVNPGITDWAQVNCRNTISWEHKYAYDVEYVDNKSFWLDLRIVGLTIIKVIQRKGINASEKPDRGIHVFCLNSHE